METSTSDTPSCRVCGAPLSIDHRYCSNCGTPAPQSPGQPDPSTADTREFNVPGFQRSVPVDIPPGESRIISPGTDETQTTWGGLETTVPPESSNRTLWIILGIVAFIILVCCCLLPLALMTITSVDSTLQDELRSLASSGLG